ncbi:MAG: hypothetical protein HN531_07440 [Opitutae bacterium]|nr:hypothetical protein [Opitutae bacterium]
MTLSVDSTAKLFQKDDMNMTPTLRPLALLSFLVCTFQVNAVEVAGYSFKAPEDWKSSPPSSNMRKAQFAVPGKSGKNGEVVFYYFGSGGAGGVKANVDRWMKQFEDPQGQSVKTETVGETKVTYAQAHGTFLSGRPFGPKTPNPGHAMLAAIIEGKKGAIFVKMTGPKETVEAHSAKLKKMVTDSLAK